jgi:hypothetical protein
VRVCIRALPQYDEFKEGSGKLKQYPWNFKIVREGIEFYQTEKTLGTDHYFYYFKVGRIDKEMRDALRKSSDDGWFKTVLGWPVFGLHKFWYDCPHAQLNLYWIVFYWSTPWTNMPKDYWDAK